MSQPRNYQLLQLESDNMARYKAFTCFSKYNTITILQTTGSLYDWLERSKEFYFSLILLFRANLQNKTEIRLSSQPNIWKYVQVWQYSIFFYPFKLILLYLNREQNKGFFSLYWVKSVITFLPLESPNFFATVGQP